jgi:4-hydroxy-3-polyprenylbenzoate decarboxylase
MVCNGLQAFIHLLEKEGELIRVREFVNPILEITEITDRISKLPDGGKALLFENTGTPFPLLINALGSEKRMAMAFGRDNPDSIRDEITTLFHKLTTPKESVWEKLKMLPELKEVSSWMPERGRGRGIGIGTGRGRGTCQEVMMSEPDLFRLPILKCWPADGGRFITLPAVHTIHPETGSPNVGMYRMQVFDKNLTGMHWHRHKTGAAHFTKYKSLGRKMPVTVTLGGDPACMYAATAPMPENMDEYLLAGFLRKKPVQLVKCLTNDLYVPEDVDFVIEGYVDPEEELILEGPFGDHTGFYSLADYYPKFHVTCITHRKNAVYPATIVGIPPMEDAWIGKATERIFLSPIRLTMIPELTDMDLPFPGVAHNISIVKINKTYPGQAVKVMNSLWGAGQMMFNKILVVVDDKAEAEAWGMEHGAWGMEQGAWGREHGAGSTGRGAQGTEKSQITNHKSQIPDSSRQSPVTSSQQPAANIDIHNYEVIAKLFTDNFDPSYSLHFSKGPLDILDHSSQKYAFGSKLGIDLTRPFPEEIPQQSGMVVIPGNEADWDALPFVTRSKSLIPGLNVPVLSLAVKKDDFFRKKALEVELSCIPEISRFKAIVLFDERVDLNDLFSLVWLLGGNLEPDRDISIIDTAGGGKIVLVDATIKTLQHDRFTRDWPNIVTMDDQTMAAIDKKWPELGLGEFLPSPSLKYRSLLKGNGAIRES